jgi:hypothetical protein
MLDLEAAIAGAPKSVLRPRSPDLGAWLGWELIACCSDRPPYKPSVVCNNCQTFGIECQKQTD